MREEDAIFLGKYKLGYRGCRNGKKGLVYIKGNDQHFVSCEELIEDIQTGPYRTIYTGQKDDKNQ